MAFEMLDVYLFLGSAAALAAIYFLLRLAMQGPRAQTCRFEACGKHAFEWVENSRLGNGWVCGDHARTLVDLDSPGVAFYPTEGLPKTKAKGLEQVRCEFCQRPSAWLETVKVKDKDGKETTETVRRAETFIRFNGGHAHAQCVEGQVPS